MSRIAITGMGAVTPVGTGVGEFWRSLVSGRCGIGVLDRFTDEDIPVRVAALVRGFDAGLYMPGKLAKDSSRFSQYAFAAAAEALGQSGLDTASEAGRTGITMGTAMAGVVDIAATQEEMTRSTESKVSPRFVPKTLGNIAAAQIAIEYGLTGPSITVSTACSSGGDAIKLAMMLLCSGEADAMVAVGADSIICPLVTSSLSMARALSRETDPMAACRPFDVRRNGFVMGEGGGALVLETEEHARARGAAILGYVLSAASNNDAYHITSPAPDGRGARACMREALRQAGLGPEDIGYINAHGTSTPVGDGIEAAAIREVFGACTPAVSSTKAATGHMMGAGGITEVISCVLACREGILPATIGTSELDPACEGVDIITAEARKCSIRTAMSNAFGFGGQNSSIIVSAE
ncbi:MAG TPA: beta-ketoacyl-[acyl-carrier-protein] synthase family protein [Candidatus Cryptobacteroides pullicola]|nr:beta-ketoacyl-[acyl-carrier-protein] synthase family protein [Candidatus Cryptobacteroides pullicola]